MDQGRGRSVAPTRPILRPQTRYKGRGVQAPVLVLLTAARNDPGARRSVTDDVRALARVPVATRLVPAAVDYPAHRLDAQVGVVTSLVAGQLRRCVVGVEAVVLRADGVVAYKGGVLALVVDVHPVLAGPEDVVAIHHVAARGSSSEDGGDVDPVSTGPKDVVATHHVAHPLVAAHEDGVPRGAKDHVVLDDVVVAGVVLDRYAVAEVGVFLGGVGDVVSGDHVSVAVLADSDAGGVSNAAIVDHPIAVGATHVDCGALVA